VKERENRPRGPRGLVAVLGSSALTCAVALVSCGEYDAPPDATGGVGPGSGGAAASSGGDTASGGAPEPVPEPSCENVVACGGDAVGSWFAQDSCLPVSGIANVSNLGIGCSEAPIEGVITVNGNWNVAADGTFSDNATTTAELTMELAAECLDISGTVSRCDRLGLVMVGAADLDEMNCVDSTITTGGCTCVGTVNQQGATAYPMAFNSRTSGTYVAADNTITVTGTSADPSLEQLAYSYCMGGRFMHVTPTTQTIFGVTSGTIVFERQE
jgi:hypothetical protein